MESDDETNVKRKRKVPVQNSGGKRKKITDLVDVEKERLVIKLLGTIHNKFCTCYSNGQMLGLNFINESCF